MIDSIQNLFAGWSRAANYQAFAWICIAVLPLVLNLLFGLNTDFRSSLGEYYGTISLFLMFQFALGFCTLFLSTMLVTGVGRSEMIEQLRLTQVRAVDLLLAVLSHLMRLLWLPAAAFLLAIFGWMLFNSAEFGILRMISFERALLFILLLFLAQLSSMLTICLGLGRNVFWFVLLALPMQFLLVGGAMFLLISRSVPWVVVPLLSLGLVVALYRLATYNLNRLWPPQ